MTHSLCDMSHSHARPEVSATTWPVAVCSGGRWEADFRRGWKAGTEEPWAFPQQRQPQSMVPFSPWILYQSIQFPQKRIANIFHLRN